MQAAYPGSLETSQHAWLQSWATSVPIPKVAFRNGTLAVDISCLNLDTDSNVIAEVLSTHSNPADPYQTPVRAGKSRIMRTAISGLVYPL